MAGQLGARAWQCGFHTAHWASGASSLTALQCPTWVVARPCGARRPSFNPPPSPLGGPSAGRAGVEQPEGSPRDPRVNLRIRASGSQ